MKRNDELKDFLKNNRPLELLTPDREKELGYAVTKKREEMKKKNPKQRNLSIIQEGDAAIDILVRSNYRLIGTVFSIYRGFVSNSIEVEEIILEMNDRLWRAAKDFHPEKGRFSSIACRYMINKIRNLYNRTKRKSFDGKTTFSINEYIPDGNGFSGLNVFNSTGDKEESPLSKLEKEERRAILNEIMEKVFLSDGVLNKKEKEVLILRFGLVGSEDTLQSVADMNSLTRERIRQIEEGALKKLRIFLRVQKFNEKLAS